MGSTATLTTPFFIVERIDRTPIVRLTRTGKTYPNVTVLEQDLALVEAALDRCKRSQSYLLINTQQAKGRNDLEFERVFAHHRIKIQEHFLRVAILVRTRVGLMQAQRHAREDDCRNRVFMDDVLAIQWLLGEAIEEPASPDM